jgi:hypothetical protein
MPLAQNQHAVGEFGPGGEYEPRGVAVRPWATWRDLDRVDARVSQDGIEGGRELTSPVADEESEPADSVTEIHHEIADLLRGPPAVRVGRRAEDMDVAAADLQHEQHVDPPDGERAVDVEEVAGQHRRSLRAQELPPGRVGVPVRCGRYARPFQDPLDGRGTDLVSELEQLTLNPLVAPVVVLGCHPFDQPRDHVVDLRTPVSVWVGPFRGYETPVPAQDGARGDQPV